MARIETQTTQTDANSPIDVALMDQGLRLNDIDHETRILALEAGGGSGSGGVDVNSLATINSGLITNNARFWRLRYSPFQNVLNSGEKIDEERTGFDPESKLQSRWISISDNDVGNALVSAANSYQGQDFSLAKSNKLSFISKKGENFFGLSAKSTATTSDSITVTIDAVAATSFNDENGTARSATFSSTKGSTQHQETEWFFDLDPTKDQLVLIENTDSAAKIYSFDSLYVGYRSPDGEFNISTDEPIHISDGVATIRGTQISFNEADLTITATTGYGKTSAIIGDTAQVLSVLEGVEPAMTQAMPAIALDWVAGFTALRCKNTSLFPSSGFLLLSQPWGQHFIASYTSKTESLINTHQFNGMLFSSTPQQNWTPLTGFGGASAGVAGDFYGDLNVNLWGTNGLAITASNNKIDFKITINTVETSHTATLNSGLYAANGSGGLDLGSEITRAMNAAKSLASTAGNYFAEYNNQTQKWIIGATGGGEIDAIDFDFSSGASVATSVHIDLGFPTTDIADALTYVATTAKQHLMAPVFQKGKFIDASHPNFKSNAAPSLSTDATSLDLRERMGFGNLYLLTTQNPMIKIFVDHDCSGLSLHYLINDQSGTLTYQIDNGQFLYLSQADDPAQIGATTRARLASSFISFARGSKTITIRMESEGNFEISATTNVIYFVGGQQYHTRPPLEALTLSQSMIKDLDIAPKQLFKTYYGEGGASFYSPTTNDNIDTITETGSWAHVASTANFNGNSRNTTVLNDTFDVAFTLADSGGGIGIMFDITLSRAREIEFYLIDGGTASETDSLIQVINQTWATLNPDQEAFSIMGLPAGSYTLRMKQRDSGRLVLFCAVAITDGIEPEPNKNTISDLTNSLQAIAYPIHTVNMSITQDFQDKVPLRLTRTGFREGHAVGDYSVNSPSITDNDEATAMVQSLDYYGTRFSEAGINSFIRSFYFCKSYCTFDNAFSTLTTALQPLIDGRNSLNTYSQRLQTKAGSVPSTTNDGNSPLFQKNFYLKATGDMSDSTTFVITDTRGLRVGQKVIIKADSQTTLIRFIATIVTDTNFTITEAIAGFASYTTANNASVYYGGFHTLRLNNDAAVTWRISALNFEPLDILESNFRKRALQTKKTETVSVQFNAVATGADLYYPTFSDGTQGNWRNSSIQVIGTSAASTYDFPENLRDVTVGAGTIDVKITSTKEVSI